jgi:hypothetical protein
VAKAQAFSDMGARDVMQCATWAEAFQQVGTFAVIMGFFVLAIWRLFKYDQHR